MVMVWHCQSTMEIDGFQIHLVILFFRLRKSKSMDGGQNDTEQKEICETTSNNEEDKATEVSSGEIVNNVAAVKDVAKELEEVEEAVGDVEEFCGDVEEDLEGDREEEDDKENDVRAAVLRRGAISAEHIREPDEENSHEKVFLHYLVIFTFLSWPCKR